MQYLAKRYYGNKKCYENCWALESAQLWLLKAHYSGVLAAVLVNSAKITTDHLLSCTKCSWKSDWKLAELLKEAQIV